MSFFGSFLVSFIRFFLLFASFFSLQLYLSSYSFNLLFFPILHLFFVLVFQFFCSSSCLSSSSSVLHLVFPILSSCFSYSSATSTIRLNCLLLGLLPVYNWVTCDVYPLNRGQTPADIEVLYLDMAAKLDTYGVDPQPVKVRSLALIYEVVMEINHRYYSSADNELNTKIISFNYYNNY